MLLLYQIQTYFKKFISAIISTKKDFPIALNKEIDEKAGLIQEQENIIFHNQILKSKKSPFLSFFKYSFLPTFYLLINIIVVIILLYKKNKQHIIFPKDVRLNQENQIPNYFELMEKISVPIVEAYTLCSFICGCLIVYFLFSIVKQRFKVPEYKEQTYKVYIMSTIGLIANLFSLAKGFAKRMDNFEELNLFLKLQIKIGITELLFICFICFSVLFSFYSLNLLNLLKQKQSYTIKSEELWYNFRIITLCYVAVFTLIYLLFLFQFYDIITIDFIMEILSRNMNYVISIFPYFIHLLNAVLFYSFYFELKYMNHALSQNLEVDYLFDIENADDNCYDTR
jgi:hypothetical protein